MDDKLFKCSMCKDRKRAFHFSHDAGRSSGLASRCKSCDAIAQQRRGERRLEGRKTIINRAKDRPCMDCGVRYPPYVMDFDHRPGTLKRFGISNALRFSIAEVIEEIDKCDLVCANCHRVRTYHRSSDMSPTDEGFEILFS